MAKAKKGDVVHIHYTGRLDDGTVFDTSRNHEPLEFTVGDGRVIRGFDQAVEGMEEGDQLTTTIPADDAYGPHKQEMMVTVAREHVPESIDPEVGQELEVTSADGNTFNVRVAETHDDHLVLDANHPLSGQALTFAIELVEIV